MNCAKLVVSMLVFATSLSANAGYFQCANKKMTVTYGQSADGIFLKAKRAGSEMGYAFSGLVDVENIAFDGKGKGLKNTKAAFAADYFNNKQAGLNLEMKAFFIEDVATGKILFESSDLKCEYSAGE